MFPNRTQQQSQSIKSILDASRQQGQLPTQPSTTMSSSLFSSSNIVPSTSQQPAYMAPTPSPQMVFGKPPILPQTIPQKSQEVPSVASGDKRLYEMLDSISKRISSIEKCVVDMSQ